MWRPIGTEDLVSIAWKPLIILVQINLIFVHWNLRLKFTVCLIWYIWSNIPRVKSTQETQLRHVATRDVQRMCGSFPPAPAKWRPAHPLNIPSRDMSELSFLSWFYLSYIWFCQIKQIVNLSPGKRDGIFFLRFCVLLRKFKVLPMSSSVNSLFYFCFQNEKKSD